jgi:hypothetical protein
MGQPARRRPGAPFFFSPCFFVERLGLKPNAFAALLRSPQEDHYKIIRQIGEESMTLLKNERGSLPITKSTRRIGVFGSSAGPHVGGLTGCEHGALSTEQLPFLLYPPSIRERVLTGHLSLPSQTATSTEPTKIRLPVSFDNSLPDLTASVSSSTDGMTLSSALLTPFPLTANGTVTMGGGSGYVYPP